MARKTLEHLLLELQRSLPAAEALTWDDVGDLEFTIEKVLGERHRIHLHMDESLSKLPGSLKSLYYALDYFQTASTFQGEVAGEGMLSAIYNVSGSDLQHSREVFKRMDAELSAAIERLCELAALVMPTSPKKSWITLNPHEDPYRIIGDDANEKIATLEEEFDSRLKTMWARTFAALGEAQRAV
ncbi:hypothetical protein FN976_17590 [Caenimonas sedimenti]|uniref:Uncharacterized protein n=1 Tax=Caenimonas sedimenti TaxID=2596921 RepID=A0A562ZMS4_9BURK|nr:hypothetical protein [Caenimonas sedimenti]TWO69646.1 hypothetical protein FN976_17590 [Caenimonas sedimenti]